jgi:hypothetical protein
LGRKVTQKKKVLEVHVEKGMVNSQKITFREEADQAPDTDVSFLSLYAALFQALSYSCCNGHSQAMSLLCFAKSNTQFSNERDLT